MSLGSIILSLVAATMLGACNTVEGFGRDLSRAGDGLRSIARDVDNSSNNPPPRQPQQDPDYR